MNLQLDAFNEVLLILIQPPFPNESFDSKIQFSKVILEFKDLIGAEFEENEFLKIIFLKITVDEEILKITDFLLASIIVF